MNKYTSHLELTVKGPLLTAATGSTSYGLDKAFHRNSDGKPAIPASHVKGKLRMALEELEAAGPPPPEMEIVRLFGERSKAEDGDRNVEDSYEPRRGLLDFSDLVCDASIEPGRRARTAIHATTLTASDNQLREVEDLFKSHTDVVWKGDVTFFAADDDAARNLTNRVLLGFKWLTTLGAEKSVGFGRLAAACLSDPQPQPIQPVALAPGDALSLRITPKEPLLVGGIKTRRTNYVFSETVLSGALIKGAIAAALARALAPEERSLTDANADRFTGFENLARNYASIRVTHAFPAAAGDPRPVRRPISAVRVDGIEYDTALCDPDPAKPPMRDGRAPAYTGDAKPALRPWIGDADPRVVFVTRTEIDDLSRRSRERNLFTCAYLCPQEQDQIGQDGKIEPGKKIEWIANVDFSAVDSATCAQVRAEFASAIASYVDGLGKLNRAVKIAIGNDKAAPAEPSRDLIVDDVVLVTLQTDTLMLDPERVGALAPLDDLKALYSAFWKEMAGNALELLDFYAHQRFLGGYLYHRYLGAHERATNPNHYYPYYLTGAGSVFRLKPNDQAEARRLLSKWLEEGLPIPDWSNKAYRRVGAAFWETCPFTPENGYGEIAVNLAYHWNKQIAR